MIQIQRARLIKFQFEFRTVSVAQLGVRESVRQHADSAGPFHVVRV